MEAQDYDKLIDRIQKDFNLLADGFPGIYFRLDVIIPVNAKNGGWYINRYLYPHGEEKPITDDILSYISKKYGGKK